MENDFEQKKDKLLDSLLERKGFQYIMDVAEEVFENPVFVGDISLNVLCHSSKAYSDPFWDYLCAVGYANASIMKESNRNGDFNALYSSDAPRIDSFSFTDKLFLSARIRDGFHVMGHVCIYALNREFTAEDEKLIIVLCKVLAYEMIYRGLSADGKIAYYSLLSDLFDGEKLSERDIHARVENAHHRFPASMRVVVLRRVEKRNQTMYFLREYLATELSESMVIVYHDELVIVCSSEKQKWEHNMNVFSQVLADQTYYCAVSRVIETPTELHQAYCQARATLNCTPKLDASEVHFYDDSLIFHLFSLTKDKETLLQMVDPKLNKLQTYDLKNGTELFKTLQIYFAENGNATRVAKRLHIHMNSVYYRRKCIEELLEIELDNEQKCLPLLLSYKILEYCLG